MKKFYFLLVLLIGLTTLSYAQTTNAPQPEKITVNVSDLTSDQLMKIKLTNEAEALKTNIQNYGSWVGVGKEVGTAVKEGLLAVVDVSDKFGNTKIGTFTMYMVAWKVIGKDLVRIILGLLSCTVITFVLYKSIRKMYPYRIRTSGSWLLFWKPSTFQIIEAQDYEGVEVMRIVLLLLLAGNFGLTYAIMFGA